MRTAPNWSGSPVADPKFDRNAVELPRYAAIERGFEAKAQGLVGQFLEGKIEKTELLRSFKTELQGAETNAYVAGRRARGEARSTISDAEAQMMQRRHERNMSFFRKFVSDMEGGRGRMNYGQRAGLYAKSLWSLYTRGETTDWEEPENANARYHWILEAGAEHCRDCIERTALSRKNGGLTWSELVEMGFPGDGDTECRTNCRCHIRPVAHSRLLPERIDDAQAAGSPEEGIEELKRLLGGPEMPLKIPGAGVPYISMAPETIVASMRRADRTGDAGELGRRMPLVPAVLARPDAVETVGDFRYYAGSGLIATTMRGDDGLWRLLALVLRGDQDDRRAA